MGLELEGLTIFGKHSILDRVLDTPLLPVSELSAVLDTSIHLLEKFLFYNTTITSEMKKGQHRKLECRALKV